MNEKGVDIMDMNDIMKRFLMEEALKGDQDWIKEKVRNEYVAPFDLLGQASGKYSEEDYEDYDEFDEYYEYDQFKINRYKQEIINEDYKKEDIARLVSEGEINSHELKKILEEITLDVTKSLSLAKSRSVEEAEIIYADAIKNYKKVSDIVPNSTSVLSNLGSFLAEFAVLKNGVEGEKIFKEAVKSFEKAIKINPDDGRLFCNFGTILANFAKVKSDNESERLYYQALIKFQKALEVNPDDDFILYNFGVTLCEMAELKNDKEAEELYNGAIKSYVRALEIKPYDSSILFNLIWVYEKKGDYSLALNAFMDAFFKGNLDINDVLGDDDWKDFVNYPKFLNLINNYKYPKY